MKEIMQTYGAMIVAVVVGIALLSGFGALKNKMSVAFAPQDILSENSANNNYDDMKNIPVPGIELRESRRIRTSRSDGPARSRSSERPREWWSCASCRS